MRGHEQVDLPGADDANRLVTIEHLDGSTTLLKLDYTYKPNSLPDIITEYDSGGLVAAVDFDYDARARLIYERREDYVDDNRDYELTYEYDQGGNRTKKIDATNQREIVYHYDLEDPSLYQSRNNRLEYYETFDVVPDPPVVVSTTWYYYNFAGNVTRVVTKPEASTQYSATRFGYAKNGETVTFVLGETWRWDGQSSCESNDTYVITFAREFRYGGGRQRYLNRELDPQNLEGGVYTVLNETWSDYDGNDIYGDFTVDTFGIPSDLRSVEPGFGRVEPWTSAGDATTTYMHSDHLGTLRETTGASTPGLRVFTAFGEPITPQNDRYGYVGAWGYQTHDEFAYVHVGARYYDPSTGRFLQRDPIGIFGGENVYAYVDSTPTVAVDPSGLATTLNPPSLAGAGFTGKEIAQILGSCAIAAGTWEEWKRRTKDLKNAKAFVRSLKKAAKNATRPRYKKAAEKLIRKQEKRIKGHEKRLREGFPKGAPPKPAG